MARLQHILTYYFDQASLLVPAAAALLSLLLTDKHAIPQQLCLASLGCSLGSAIASTVLLSSFVSAQAFRLAWSEGGCMFVIALSAPGSWLRWGILMLQGSLLGYIYVGQPIGAKIIGTALLAIQLFFLFGLPILGQALYFLGRSKVSIKYACNLFTPAMPLRPQVHFTSFDQEKGRQNDVD